MISIPIATLSERFKDEIKSDIESNRPTYFLFSLYPESEFHPEGKVVLAQGRFLARTTPTLVKLIASLLELDETTLTGRLR